MTDNLQNVKYAFVVDVAAACRGAFTNLVKRDDGQTDISEDDELQGHVETLKSIAEKHFEPGKYTVTAVGHLIKVERVDKKPMGIDPKELLFTYEMSDRGYNVLGKGVFPGEGDMLDLKLK